jgi:hypothetical protein
MSSSARILIAAISAIALSSPFSLEAAHADWRCHIHPNIATAVDTSGVASGKGSANHPAESARFNFGKIEQAYTPQK